MKIWRVAGVVSLLGVLIVGGFFVHAALVAGHLNPIADLNPYVAVALLLVQVAIFLVGIVTFPYYWFRVVRQRQAGAPFHIPAGLVASLVCIFVALFIMQFVFHVGGS